MRLEIYNYNNEENHIFGYGREDLKPVIPEIGETILVNLKWYKVRKRLLSYREVNCLMDQTVYLWVEKQDIPDQEIGVIPDSSNIR